MKRRLTCICCPLGCAMTAEGEGGEWSVTGNSCPRGRAYAEEEMTAPVRMVTTTLPVIGGKEARVPAKTPAPIPKEGIFDLLRAAKGARATAPVKEGDVLFSAGGFQLVAAADVEKADEKQ